MPYSLDSLPFLIFFCFCLHRHFLLGAPRSVELGILIMITTLSFVVYGGRGNRHDDEHLKLVFSGKNMKGFYWRLIGASVFITGFGFGIDWLFSLLSLCLLGMRY
jgi:hypothetical protein